MDSSTDLIKVLIIDDEATIRRSFSDYLEDHSFEVVTAENGRIGLELIEKEKPQIVLVDLRMPEVNGLEVLKLSREFAPEIPKIVISGINQISDVVRALRYGAWDYLEKPVKDLSMLKHAVTKVLERARLLNENREYQEHLETMVQERTQELKQANIHLSNINTRLKKIVETTHGLSAISEIAHLGVKILDEFAHHMLATGGSLYFVEDDGLRKMHSLDPGHAPDFIPFPLSEHSVLRQVIESGKPLLVQDVINDKTFQSSGWDGYKDGSLLSFPIPDNLGKTVGVLTLHSKIEPPFVEQDKEIGAILASYSCETMRAVQAFEALQKSEKQYRTLFEKTNDAIFIVEKSTGKYLDANQAAAELTGRSHDELIKMNTREVTPEDAAERILTITDPNSTEDLGRVTYCRPDNTLRIAKLSAVALGNDAVIGIARDVTQDLKIEKQLRQSQKMEAIGTLAGGIAHDFNNILSGIFGYAQLADMNLDNPDQAKKDIDQVIKGAQRAADLVQQILTFSRQTEHQQAPLKIYCVVKEALKFLRSSIPVTIKIKEEISSKSMVLADATQTHQVVMNLCTNAYHAMNESGGTLTVTLTDTEITQSDYAVGRDIVPGNYVRLDVSDTGYGMETTILDKIFDPYYTTKKPDKGTGLGLAVVDGIVKKHNGFINAFSEIGHGSTFQVFWPIIEKDQLNTISEKTKIILPKGTEQIMLVDDETDILVPAQAILERQGYKVTIFEDGMSALNAFTENPDRFDLVITDMAMPQMTGDDLAVRILKIRNNMPIILCTGYNEQFTEDKALEIGVSEYVQKPISVMNLLTLTREVLDR